MAFTPEQELAVSKFRKALNEYQTKEVIANLFVFIMTLASLLLPIILSFTSGNFLNLLLILIYPISGVFMALPRYRYSNMNVFVFSFIGVVLVIFFINLLNGPGWYYFIFFGLSASNHLLLSELPVLKMKVEKCASDKDFLAVKDKLE